MIHISLFSLSTQAGCNLLFASTPAHVEPGILQPPVPLQLWHPAAVCPPGIHLCLSFNFLPLILVFPLPSTPLLAFLLPCLFSHTRLLSHLFLVVLLSHSSLSPCYFYLLPPSSTCFVPGSLPARCARSSLFPRRFRKKCSAFLLSPSVISVLLLGCPPQAAGAAGRSPSSGGQTRGRQPAPCFCCSAPGEVLSESLASPLPRGGRRRSLAAARVRAGTWRVTAGLILLLRCSKSWVCF